MFEHSLGSNMGARGVHVGLELRDDLACGLRAV
jgi:hypothetical protein